MTLVATLLQVLGLLAGAWGVHEVRQSLAGATSRSIRWLRGRGGRVRLWTRRSIEDTWARLRRRPVVRTANVQLSGTATLTSSFSIKVGPRPIDPDTVTDREWLALLTEQLDGVYGHLNALRDQQGVDRQDAERRLRQSITGLDESQRADAHRGLAWIYVSLVLTFAGTVLGGLE
ncbi:hypothetical protein [Kineococcus auxinigenes]|uniref:hypothetical protein n=1 Tax=unclassified Kineococcus TaxID=2621656 RepID=UPI003D7D4AC2